MGPDNFLASLGISIVHGAPKDNLILLFQAFQSAPACVVFSGLWATEALHIAMEACSTVVGLVVQ